MRVVLSLAQKNSQQTQSNSSVSSASAHSNSQRSPSPPSSGSSSASVSAQNSSSSPSESNSPSVTALAVVNNSTCSGVGYRKRESKKSSSNFTPSSSKAKPGEEFRSGRENERSNSNPQGTDLTDTGKDQKRAHHSPSSSPLAHSSSSASSSTALLSSPPGSGKNPSYSSSSKLSSSASAGKTGHKGRYKSIPDTGAGIKEKARKRKPADSKPQARGGTHKKQKNYPLSTASSTSASTPARLKAGDEKRLSEGTKSSRSGAPTGKKTTKMARGSSQQHWDETNCSRSIYEDDNRENRDDPIEVRNDSRCYEDHENDPAAAFSNLGEVSRFEEALKKRGLELVEMEGDGNCLFRAVSYQVYGDSNMHGEVRRRCLDFMAKDEAHFSQFVVGEPFRDYIRRKRRDGVHGNNPEIQAISELFNRPVELFVPENAATPINIFHAEYKTADPPIRLSYHNGNHYNAVTDPLCPTAGLGLGLPGLEPGLADRMQVKAAVEESDRLADQIQIEKAMEESQNIELQRAMLESEEFTVDNIYKQKAMALSDIEATDFELEQAVLASSLEQYGNNQGRKQPWSNREGGVPKRRIGNDSRSTESMAHSLSTSSASGVATSSSRSVAAASSASASHADSIPSQFLETPQDEYPPVVQELVMNGFELPRVLHAYDLIGDSFDDLLAFLMNSGR